MKNRPILVVEDNEDDQFLLAHALEVAKVSHPLAFVKDVKSAKDYLRQNIGSPDASPCLILLDLTLPIEGGLEFLQAIRAEPKTRRLPVVVLTGSCQQQDLMNSYAYGANSYITKTGDLDEFYSKMSCLCMYWLDVCQLPVG
jgi:CheY-like chemotaxis protein